MGFFGPLVSSSNTSSDRVMRSDIDMPLTRLRMRESDQFLGRSVLGRFLVRDFENCFGSGSVRAIGIVIDLEPRILI